MSTQVVTKDEILRSLDELPAEKLVDVQQFIEFLRSKAQRRPRKLAKLGGLWKDLPPITEEDIAQARHEMWGNFGEREP
jgi:hypothetical protein